MRRFLHSCCFIFPGRVIWLWPAIQSALLCRLLPQLGFAPTHCSGPALLSRCSYYLTSACKMKCFGSLSFYLPLSISPTFVLDLISPFIVCLPCKGICFSFFSCPNKYIPFFTIGEGLSPAGSVEIFRVFRVTRSQRALSSVISPHKPSISTLVELILEIACNKSLFSSQNIINTSLLVLLLPPSPSS